MSGIKIPRNSWMNDLTIIAQIAHALGAYAILLTFAFFTNAFRTRTVFCAAAVLVVYAAIKEFWYDANYEDPKQTTKDNVIDFVGYMIGIVLGLAVTLGVPKLVTLLG